jgi:hypothetical protein
MDASEAIQRLQDLGFDDFSGDRRVADGAKRVLDASFVRVQRNAILNCLDIINLAANGDVPSASTGRRHNEQTIADAQYWVSTILSKGLHVLAKLRASNPSDVLLHDTLLAAITTIADAWSHVLAGDIDNLSKELEWSRT